MKLSQSERDNLFEALLDGYRNYDKLKIMVGLKLGENIARFSKEADSEIVIFSLIEWAESENRVLDLVWGANEKNPGNPQIKDITYQLFGITKKQWKELCQLLSKISPGFLEIACQQSFKSEITEVEPRLIELKKFNNFDNIQPILKDNLIKKREQSSRDIPIILEFVDSLSRIKDISSAIRNDLKEWVSEVANQLNIKLETKQNNPSPSKPVETKIIQPYLLISFEDRGSDLELQGELVIQENDSDAILQQESIYIQEQKQGVNCAKNLKKIGYYVQQFINSSYTKLRAYRNQNRNSNIQPIIIELFLPTKFLLYKMETVLLKVGGKFVKLGCQYRLIFRTLERFEIHRDSQDSSNRLENNWIEFKNNFQSQFPLTPELVENRFEHYSYCNEQCQELEQRLRDNRKIGINLIFPLDKNDLKIMADIIWAINTAGIPLALWRINKNNNSENLREEFIQLLTSTDIKNFNHLLSHIRTLRGKAYNPKPENHKSLGYGLGFLCDNPYRVLSRFKEEEEDVLTFG